MNVAALVVGIVGAVLSLIPCLGMYALPLTIIAIVLGALAMKKPAGKGLAIAGLVCGIVGTAIASWWVYAYLTIKHAADDQIAKDKAAAAAAPQPPASPNEAPATEPEKPVAKPNQ